MMLLLQSGVYGGKIIQFYAERSIHLDINEIGNAGVV